MHLFLLGLLSSVHFPLARLSPGTCVCTTKLSHSQVSTQVNPTQSPDDPTSMVDPLGISFVYVLTLKALITAKVASI